MNEQHNSTIVVEEKQKQIGLWTAGILSIMGLAIVKSILDQHDGQISVESEQNKGSCFSVLLPLFSTSKEQVQSR